VRAGSVRSGIERMHGRGREGVRFVLVEGEVDVRQREPGAVGLPVGRDRNRRLRHGRGGPLDRGGNVFAARQGFEGALGGSVACARRSPTALGPREPLRVRAVFGRGHDLLGVDLPPLLHDLPRGPPRGTPRLRGIGRRVRLRCDRRRHGERRGRWRLRRVRLGCHRRGRWLRSRRSRLRFLNGREPMLGRDVDLRRPRRDLNRGRPVDRRVGTLLLLDAFAWPGTPGDVRLG
jgi:hypothetical protein